MRKLAALLDFPARDLDRVPHAIEEALLDFGGAKNFEIETIIVCHSLADVDRVLERGRSRHLHVQTEHQFREFVRREDVDGILDLLGVEVRAVDHHALRDECNISGKSYYGPKLNLNEIVGQVQDITPRVVSVVADGKHCGKTLISMHLAAALRELGHSPLVVSIERSPDTIDDRPNLKSDYIRARRKNIAARHIMRIGDWFLGVARMEHSILPEPEYDYVIVDNSGASIAPIKPDLIVEVGNWSHESLVPRLFGRTEIIRPTPLRKSKSTLDVTYDVECEIDRTVGDPLQEGALAIGLFLYRGLTREAVAKILPSNPFSVIMTKEVDLRQKLNVYSNIELLVTDDYTAERYRPFFNTIVIVSPRITNLGIERFL